MATFGPRIRELRERRELTQGDLAKRLAVVTSTVSQWETDKRMPDSPMLQQIADFFGVSVDYLLGRTDSPGPQGSDRLPDWINKLPPEMQDFVKEESKNGWPYLRLASGLKAQDLSPAELQAIIETWMDAKRRYQKEFGSDKPED